MNDLKNICNNVSFLKLEFRKSDGSPGITEVKFVEFISPAKGYFRKMYKSHSINPISPTAVRSPWESYRLKLKA